MLLSYVVKNQIFVCMIVNSLLEPESPVKANVVTNRDINALVKSIARRLLLLSIVVRGHRGRCQVCHQNGGSLWSSPASVREI